MPDRTDWIIRVWACPFRARWATPLCGIAGSGLFARPFVSTSLACRGRLIWSSSQNRTRRPPWATSRLPFAASLGELPPARTSGPHEANLPSNWPGSPDERAASCHPTPRSGRWRNPHSSDPGLPTIHQSHDRASLPVPTNVQRVLHSGTPQARPPSGNVEGRPSDLALPSMASGGVRPAVGPTGWHAPSQGFRLDALDKFVGSPNLPLTGGLQTPIVPPTLDSPPGSPLFLPEVGGIDAVRPDAIVSDRTEGTSDGAW